MQNAMRRLLTVCSRQRVLHRGMSMDAELPRRTTDCTFCSVTVLGRLTHDVERRISNTNNEYFILNMAVNRMFNGTQETDFHRIMIFNVRDNARVFMENNYKKGALVIAQGMLRNVKVQGADGSVRNIQHIRADFNKLVKPAAMNQYDRESTYGGRQENQNEDGESDSTY